MRTLAVVPIKSFGASKTRLAGALGNGSRQLLAQAMFADVLAALRRMTELDGIAVVTDDHEVEALLRGERVILLEDTERAGQSAAARIGIEHAVEEGYRRVLLVPGDTPLADPPALDRLLHSSRTEKLAVTIVPDRHGAGTNALVLTPPHVMEPRFGTASLERHVEAADAAGLDHRVEEVPSLMHDVDTPEDLTALADVLERSRGVAPRTRGALRQFDRLRTAAERAAAASSAREPGPEAEHRLPGERAGPRTVRPQPASADQTPAWA